MNRYLWNYRVPGPSEVPGLFVMEAQGGGPMVPPGAYQVKLTAGGRDYTAALEIKADPRVKVSQADLEKQYQFALQCRDRVSQIHDTVNRLRAARAELAALRRSSAGGSAEIEPVVAKMGAIEEQLVQVNSTNRSAALVYPIMLDAQFADLANVAEAADSAPPAQVYEAFQEYDKKREQLFTQWEALQPQIASLKSKLGGAANAK